MKTQKIGGNTMNVYWLTIYASNEMRPEHVLERVKFHAVNKGEAESKVAAGEVKTEYPLEYFKITIDKK